MSEGTVIAVQKPENTEPVIRYEIADANYTYAALDCLPASARHDDGVKWYLDHARDARLALGLWEALEGSAEAVPGGVPLEVAAANRSVFAAYLYVAPSQGGTQPGGRANHLGDPRRHTQWYLSGVRWDWPATE